MGIRIILNGIKALPRGLLREKVIFAAVCNGKQAGGGQQLAPAAMIDDGLLDLVALTEFPPGNIPRVIQELMETEAGGDYVRRFRVPWADWDSEVEMPVNLDGEPISIKKIRFEAMPGVIKLVLPENCPVITACS